MQRFFTKNLFLIVLSFVTVDMMAQTINTLTINSPSGIAGDYLAVRAGFGNQANDPITGNAAFANDGSTTGTGGTVNDGCQPLVNNVTGLITFVDRGVCQFGAKALAAPGQRCHCSYHMQ
ncbi:MAG: hypothetical protein IPL08_09335 [Saprospiraceae bacterium]|nr:hypothetical protein [Saprospiraceae bacterium]